MDISDIGLFRLAERRLGWIDQRQLVLAQNIANADTPGYQARDLPSFAKVLAGSAAGAGLARTEAGHLSGGRGAGASQADRMLRPTERAPDGNAVSVERELMKVADMDTQQTLVTSLYRKYLGMFRTALGKG